MKKLVSSLFTVVASLLVPVSVHAINLQSTFETAKYDEASEAMGGAFVLVVMAVYCCFILFAIINFVIWILSLIDIAKRENWKGDNDKMLWLLLVIFVPLVDFYYYFFHRKTLDKDTVSSTTSIQE